jgi:phosphohistidine phosphatase
MAIYLVQHGKSLSKEQDPEKGLSAEGSADVQLIARVAASYGVKVAGILHSGKKRTLQTAEIMAEELKPANGVQAVEGINPLDDAVAYAASVDLSSNNMIVGHLPFLERLAAYLVTGQEQFPVFEMQNGGILCLDDYRDGRRAVIKWALMPNIE